MATIPSLLAGDTDPRDSPFWFDPRGHTSRARREAPAAIEVVELQDDSGAPIVAVVCKAP